MVSYTKEEIVPSSFLTRNLSKILDNLKERKTRKVAVLRNNVIEAVIIPVERYELLIKKAKFAEKVKISQLVKQRESTLDGNTMSMEEVMKEHGITEDDLQDIVS